MMLRPAEPRALILVIALREPDPDRAQKGRSVRLTLQRAPRPLRHVQFVKGACGPRFRDRLSIPAVSKAEYARKEGHDGKLPESRRSNDQSPNRELQCFVLDACKVPGSQLLETCRGALSALPPQRKTIMQV
jgi:hypothetical protein